jgi:hypothetical protein
MAVLREILNRFVVISEFSDSVTGTRTIGHSSGETLIVGQVTIMIKRPKLDVVYNLGCRLTGLTPSAICV